MWKVKFIDRNGVAIWRTYKYMDEVQLNKVIRSMEKSLDARHVLTEKVY